MPVSLMRKYVSRWCEGSLRVAASIALLASVALSQAAGGTAAVQTVPPLITLEDAIARARTNEPGFVAAVASSKTAALDRSIARAGLLPSVTYNNQFLYTEPNHCPNTNKICVANATPESQSAPVRFIANNAVHEYASQGSVTETFGAQGLNAVSKASASLAVAMAEQEIARRGLVVSVAGLFYGVASADRRVGVADRAATEAASLTKLTQQREAAREVAHADVLKAQLQQQQRDRDLADARVEAQKARLELAVLLFPDPRAEYTLAVPDAPAPVPARADVEAALAKRNPDLESALASLHLADSECIRSTGRISAGP